MPDITHQRPPCVMCVLTGRGGVINAVVTVVAAVVQVPPRCYNISPFSPSPAPAPSKFVLSLTEHGRRALRSQLFTRFDFQPFFLPSPPTAHPPAFLITAAATFQLMPPTASARVPAGAKGQPAVDVAPCTTCPERLQTPPPAD